MDSENKGSLNVKIMERNTQAFLISGRTGWDNKSGRSPPRPLTHSDTDRSAWRAALNYLLAQCWRERERERFRGGHRLNGSDRDECARLPTINQPLRPPLDHLSRPYGKDRKRKLSFSPVSQRKDTERERQEIIKWKTVWRCLRGDDCEKLKVVHAHRLI
ncbi:hypothetical protein DPX16_4342 [Anabarilius grahami]|uniref:Uncharacterized protein n=1 Tax=Anabarilius grahami TaxID=495550 RepID=A0A3N0YTS2_ANAGA|nr:hypothetical protein DPX16_4342 [Anabarilius grahami]